ncbi:MAG: prepilin-type N-terminal cleavage/methylation domain-containing protein, partial [Clostridium sp.]
MRKKEKGFTLVEMIAAIAIFGIISIVTVSMLSFAFKYNAINRETYEADTNSKIFFESI